MTADLKLRDDLMGLARVSGQRLLDVFDPHALPENRAELLARMQRNEALSQRGLRESLHAMRPEAGWVTDALETTPLPAGEWWVVDAVEGNVNHVHGSDEWCVSLALVRDNVPTVAVVYQPIGALAYSAVRGGGASINGRKLTASRKTDLAGAIVGTGQAEAGQTETYRRIGDSIATMLGHALVVRATVPSTFPLVRVASGQHDGFWQYGVVLPGVAAGMLLATEAGAIGTRVDGSPWRPGARDILVAAPALHASMVKVLS